MISLELKTTTRQRRPRHETPALDHGRVAARIVSPILVNQNCKLNCKAELPVELSGPLVSADLSVELSIELSGPLVSVDLSVKFSVRYPSPPFDNI